MSDRGRQKKRAKVGSGGGIDWRAKCVEEFGLRPVPESWRGDFDEWSDDETWKNYYKYRKGLMYEHAMRGYDDGGVYSDADDDDDESEKLLWEKNLYKEWRARLDILERDATGGNDGEHWQAHLSLGELHWKDHGEALGSAEFLARVFSPYAVPRAACLKHRYHRWSRGTTVDFCVTWGYQLVDFGTAPSQGRKQFRTLCSNRYRHENVLFDVIDASHLTGTTVGRLRRFLLVGAADKTGAANGDDYSFLRLLFGSMGTFECKTLKAGEIGYTWSPPGDDVELRERMVRDLAIARDERPVVSWLEHALRTAAGLGFHPLVKTFYEPPIIEKAPGYCPGCLAPVERRKLEHPERLEYFS